MGITVTGNITFGNGITITSPPAPTLTQVGSGSSITNTATIPVGARSAGDIAVILASYRASSGPPADFTPTNWTKIGTVLQPSGTALVRINAYYKILNGAEATTVTTGPASGLSWTGSQIWVWRPSSTVSTVTVNNLTQLGSTNAISQTITTNGVVGPLIAIGHAAAQTNTIAGWLSWTGLAATQTFFRTSDGTAGADPTTGAYTLVNGGSTAGSDITASITDIGLQELQTFYLTFS